MEPWEVMISESQERMLAVVEPEKVEEVLALAERYELVGAVVGRVAGHGDLRVVENGEVVGTVPAEHLADAPVYEREVVRPRTSTRYRSSTRASFPSPRTTTKYCSRCSPIRTCARGVRSSPSTTTRSARIPWSCPARTPPS